MNHSGEKLFHHLWTQRNQDEPPELADNSPLLDLHRSSDVNDIGVEQIRDARNLLRHRRSVQDACEQTGAAVHDDERVQRLQRTIVERFLAGRRDYYGAAECEPFQDAARMAREGRDVFLVVKFMDEAPHLEATLRSLLNQAEVDLRRVTIVAVDNNSRDGSDQIVQTIAGGQATAARIVYLNQSRPGAGHAARLGVDRSIATIYEMCRIDGRWSRLQTAVVGVSDGDTVYHPHVLKEILGILDEDDTVDGVMPFLTYKLTAALRLFATHVPAEPHVLRARSDPGRATRVDIDLSRSTALQLLPRWRRHLRGERMTMEVLGQGMVTVRLDRTDPAGRRFGVLADAGGCLAYVLEDRTVVLEEAPVSNFDCAVTYLENGLVKAEEKWRWHAVVGHDLFLYWAFAVIGLPEAMVFPDTSDALKTFRSWSFAIGGQHQLARHDLRIATGSDYQSGRVLQAVGNTVRLAPAGAYAETEIDRLTKMIRNLVHKQAVFYGETRATALDRATGLYVHMTPIQQDLEAELRGYTDEIFERTVFPERMLFLFRWILQNAVRFYAHGEEARRVVRERVLDVMFQGAAAESIESRWFNPVSIKAVRDAPYADQQDIAEAVAEGLIGDTYREIVRFYARTLRNFFDAQHVPPERFAWLLEGLEESRNAVLEKPPPVHPAAVWDGDEFVIDQQRGQVVRMRPHERTTSSETSGER